MPTTLAMITTKPMATRKSGTDMNIDQVNTELELLAQDAREEQISIAYEEFMEEMYYILECDQWERDMEIYNEFA